MGDDLVERARAGCAAPPRSSGARSRVDGGAVVGGEAAPGEGAPVPLHLPRPFSSMARSSAARPDRHAAALEREAEQEQVRGDRVAEQRGREARRGQEVAPSSAPAALRIASSMRVGAEVEVRVRGELGGRGDVGVHDRGRPPRREPREVLGARRDDEVAGDQEVARPVRDARGVDRAGSCAMRTWLETGAVLLGEPGHVELRAALALEVRGHGEDRADGHDAGAADPGDEHVERPLAVGRRRQRQRRERRLRRPRRPRGSPCGACRRPRRRSSGSSPSRTSSPCCRTTG